MADIGRPYSTWTKLFASSSGKLAKYWVGSATATELRCAILRQIEPIFKNNADEKNCDLKLCHI